MSSVTDASAPPSTLVGLTLGTDGLPDEEYYPPPPDSPPPASSSEYTPPGLNHKSLELTHFSGPPLHPSIGIDEVEVDLFGSSPVGSPELQERRPKKLKKSYGVLNSEDGELNTGLGQHKITKSHIENSPEDEVFHCCKRIGSCYLLYGRRKSMWPFHCFVGPDWLCQSCTVALVIIPTFFFVKNVTIPHTHWFFTVVAMVLGAATLLALLLTGCSDPGVIFPTLLDESDVHDHDSDRGGVGPRKCEQCSHPGEGVVYKVPGSSHCYDCGLCVEELDHHCPWSGKCIAKRNLRFFYWFLTCLGAHMAYVVVTSAVIFGMNNDRTNAPAPAPRILVGGGLQ